MSRAEGKSRRIVSGRVMRHLLPRARRGPAFRAAALALALAAVPAAAQEGFGFGEPEAEAAAALPSAGPASGASVGGELSFSIDAFYRAEDEVADLPFEGLAEGVLEFKASGTKVEAFIKLKLSENILGESPEDMLDEAYLRLYLGPHSLEGGLLKLVWGKADSQGPLDVLNPFDLRDLRITETLERKIAEPMLHATFALGDFTKLELAFLPGFEGHRIAAEGPWAPAQVEALELLGIDFEGYLPDTEGLEYAQAGLRFTTSSGPVDWGLQYFYGRLPTPAVVFIPPVSLSLSYDPYHQLGLDAAAVFAGFNLRAEAAANLTEDLEGDDPEVYNPSLLWSLGFDRDLFGGINLNLQGSGSFRLAEEGVGEVAYDIEADTERTRTRVTAILSQKLRNETIEWELRALYGIEDADFYLLPRLAFDVGDAEIEIGAGIFGGDEEGELGQFAESSWARLLLSYEF